MMELDPGKTAWPFHYHQANEEALYVLAGEATLRLGSQRLRVRAGDYVALPAGPDDAHQLTNTGAELVRYLVISTMVTPDVCVYPDANKVGVVGALTDADGRPQRVVTFMRDAEVDYWEGEATTLDPHEPSSAKGSAHTGATSEGATQADAHEPNDARQATIDQMVESDLAALKRKLERESTTDHDSTADRNLEDLKATLDEDD